MNKPIILGSISGVFGVQGWVKVFSHTEPRNNILQYNPWYIKKDNSWIKMDLFKGRIQGKTLVAKLDKVKSREEAHALIGCEIAVDESQLEPLSGDEFYWRDLVGLDVFTLNDVRLGEIASLMPTGANDVLVVKTDKDYLKASAEKEFVKEITKEILIPYLPNDVISKVDLALGKIWVDWDGSY